MITTAKELRQAVANLASSQEGVVGGDKYWREVLPSWWHGPYPQHWCGGMALWCLIKELGCTWRWEVSGITNRDNESGFLFRLRPTSEPDIGDICYLAEPYQHHAVLTAIGVQADGHKFTITQDGNQGNAPGTCLECYKVDPKWTAIYSIEPLVQAALIRINGAPNT